MIQTLLIRKEQMKVSRWSGGTTTQIDLFPDTATYGARDFTFRVSSATIEESPSQFTALPDYQRWITMLSGPVALEHGQAGEQADDLAGGQARGQEEGQAPGLKRIDSRVLEPLQVHSFDGGTPTTSTGVARDFNLMLRKGLAGDMVTLALSPQTELNWIGKWLSERSPESQGHLAVYWPEALLVSESSHSESEAALRVAFEETEVLLGRGDYLRLSGTVKALKEVHLMLEVNSDLLLLYMET